MLSPRRPIQPDKIRSRFRIVRGFASGFSLESQSQSDRLITSISLTGVCRPFHSAWSRRHAALLNLPNEFVVSEPCSVCCMADLNLKSEFFWRKTMKTILSMLIVTSLALFAVPMAKANPTKAAASGCGCCCADCTSCDSCCCRK